MMVNGGVPLPPSHSNVVIVNGLTSECTPDALFTLFGVYGDVMRVKIMFNKRDTGLVQFFDGTQARLAAEHLSGADLQGSVLRVNESKHNQVSIPAEESQFSKDYQGSILHRYRRGVKNAKNICAPSAMLHISNIPQSAQENDAVLKPLFEAYSEVKSFRFFEHDRKMAIVEMADTAAAIHALIGLHNKKIDEKYIKISFSKNKQIQN